jgi:hypothetical protein
VTAGVESAPMRGRAIGALKPVAVARRMLIALGAAAFLSACQTATPEEVLDQGTPGAGDVAQETLGQGAVTVAMLLPRSAGGSTGAAAREYRDGAALAMTDLGAEHVSLVVSDTGGSSSIAASRAAQAIGSGARMLIGPASGAELSALPGERPPVIALVDNTTPRGSGIFAFRSDETDSALAAVDHARAAGKRVFVALVAPGTTEAATSRLKQGIEAVGGVLSATIPFTSATDLGGANAEAVAGAEAVIVFAGADPAQALAAYQAAPERRSDALMIATNGWTQAHYRLPTAAGAIVPVLDQGGLREVGARMQSAYGRPMTLEAAYAYDAVALAAGIVRAVGAEGLSAVALTQPSGFRGATGAFRFSQDGSVSRLFSIYSVGAGGSLQPVQAAPAGF